MDDSRRPLVAVVALCVDHQAVMVDDDEDEAGFAHEPCLHSSIVREDNEGVQDHLMDAVEGLEKCQANGFNPMVLESG